MKVLFAFLVFLCFQAEAYQAQIKVYDTISKMNGGKAAVTDRQVAQAADAATPAEENVLVYYSPDARQVQKTYVVNASTWANFRRQGNTRLDLFLKLYYANVKSLSRSGQRHVGCFLGNAEQVAREFFKTELPISNIDKQYLTVSEDGKLIGFEFDYQNPSGPHRLVNAHFRLPHCIQGSKAPLIEMEQIRTAQRTMPEPARAVASVKNIRLPASKLEGENGFEMYDKMNPNDANAESAKRLPRFRLKGDYDRIQTTAASRPWRGMDISTEAGGRKFAHAVLDYFYDSLVTDLQNPDQNFIAHNTPAGKSQWCHMPWLNVGDSGRELIHGLTKERDLETSQIYPDAATTKEKQGSNWGIGFYNDIACATAFNIFGSNDRQASTPDFTKANFPDGSVSVKVLFTTANLDALKGAYTWTANVSNPKSTSRALRPVRMVQIDIAVKDSTLKGARTEVDGWMMTTFYFDASYIAPSRHTEYTGLLAGLNKMRPIGIQTGFDPSTSLIFSDAKTNSANNFYYGADPKLLNGPADNPKASCLSCHGAAGTSVSMVPGIKDFNGFKNVKDRGLDFSQQLALAKRNYETRIGQKSSAGWNK
jgi:hypothetical protein